MILAAWSDITVLATTTTEAPVVWDVDPSTSTICEGAGAPDFTVATLTELEDALTNVQAGQYIYVQDGVYEITSDSLFVRTDNVLICGQSKGGTIIQVSENVSSPQALLEVEADGFRILRLTLRNKNTNGLIMRAIETANSTVYVDGFSVRDVVVEHVSWAFRLRAKDWDISFCIARRFAGDFIGPFIGFFGCVGTCAITNNVLYEENAAAGGVFIHSVSGAPETDHNEGNLIVANNSQFEGNSDWISPLQSLTTFLQIEVFRGTGLGIEVIGNKFTGAEGFIVLSPRSNSAFDSPNDGDGLGFISLGGNRVSNYNGRGLITITSPETIDSFRSTPLLVVLLQERDIVYDSNGVPIDDPSSHTPLGYDQCEGSSQGLVTFNTGSIRGGTEVTIIDQSTTSTTTGPNDSSCLHYSDQGSCLADSTCAWNDESNACESGEIIASSHENFAATVAGLLVGFAFLLN